MNNGLKILDVVALSKDLPEKHLLKGQVGAIVEDFGDNTYLIEFSDNNGHVYAAEELKTKYFIKLHYEPEPEYA